MEDRTFGPGGVDDDGAMVRVTARWHAPLGCWNVLGVEVAGLAAPWPAKPVRMADPTALARAVDAAADCPTAVGDGGRIGVAVAAALGVLLSDGRGLSGPGRRLRTVLDALSWEAA